MHLHRIVSALIALVFLSTVVDARPRGAPFTTSFNGGKSQVNFNFLYPPTGEFPYLNLLKNAQPWAPIAGTDPILPSMLDANGWPTSLGTSTGFQTLLSIPFNRPGNYVITWTGNGTISFSSSTTILPTRTVTASIAGTVMTVSATSGTITKGYSVVGAASNTIVGDQISGSAGSTGTYRVSVSQTLGSGSLSLSGGGLTGSGGSGRYVFSTPERSINFRITGLPVTDAKFFHVDDEDRINAGEIFGVKFKERLVQAKFGAVRYLNYLVNNTTNMTTWSTRKPRGYWSYASYELRSDLYAGYTTGTNSYVTAAFPAIHSSNGSAWTSGGPLHGDTVHVVFGSTAAAAPCTIDIGATGTAINILNRAAGTLGAASYPVAGTPNSLATLVYDATLNAWIKQGGGTTGGGWDALARGIENGIPVEDALQLATEIGAHPQINIPVLAITPMTDYVPSIAAYFRDNAPPWMRPKFEPPNELWNNRPSEFFQTGYAIAIATAYGWSGDYNQWYGKAASTIGQAVAAAYGVSQANVKTQTRYDIVASVQTIGATSPGNMANQNGRLSASNYVNNVGGLQSPPQSGYTLSAASDWTTRVDMATYFNSSWYGDPDIQPALVTAFSGKAFVASATAGVMTVTAINASSSTNIAVNDLIFDTPRFVSNVLPSGLTVSSLGTGTGGVGTYNLSSAVSFASQDITAAATLAGVTNFVNASTAPYSNVTFIAGTPGQMTWVGHPLSVNDRVNIRFAYPNGAGPGGISSSTTYYVESVIDADHVTLKTTSGGSAVTITGSLTGTAVAFKSFNVANLDETKFYGEQWKGWALSFGITKMGVYEGGYSPDFAASGNSQDDLFRGAGLGAASLAAFNTQMLTDFVGLSGGGMTAEFPSNYLLSGAVSRGYINGAWGILNDVYQTPNSPQFDSIQTFNANWLLKRDIDPSSNDNDPMWLEKAA